MKIFVSFDFDNDCRYNAFYEQLMIDVEKIKPQEIMKKDKIIEGWLLWISFEDFPYLLQF